MKRVFCRLVLASILAVSVAGCSQQGSMQAELKGSKVAQTSDSQTFDDTLAGYDCSRMETFTGSQICR